MPALRSRGTPGESNRCRSLLKNRAGGRKLQMKLTFEYLGIEEWAEDLKGPPESRNIEKQSR